MFSKPKHEKQLAPWCKQWLMFCLANFFFNYNNLEMQVKMYSVTFADPVSVVGPLHSFRVVKVYRLSVLTPTNPHIILTLSRVSETPTFLPSVGLETSDFQVVGTLCFPSIFVQCISSLMFIFTKLFLFSSSMSFCILIWLLVSWCMVKFFLQLNMKTQRSVLRLLSSMGLKANHFAFH